jgi:hypothetical protein
MPLEQGRYGGLLCKVKAQGDHGQPHWAPQFQSLMFWVGGRCATAMNPTRIDALLS